MEAIQSLVRHVVRVVSNFSKPTALALCGLVIWLCWPTLQACAHVLANDVVNYNREPDLFTRTVAMLTHHTLIVILAVLADVLALGATVIVCMIVTTEIMRQLKRQRIYAHQGTRGQDDSTHDSSTGSEIPDKRALPANVTPIERHRIRA